MKKQGMFLLLFICAVLSPAKKKAPKDAVPWPHAEEDALRKNLVKFPKGTPDRWRNIQSQMQKEGFSKRTIDSYERKSKQLERKILKQSDTDSSGSFASGSSGDETQSSSSGISRIHQREMQMMNSFNMRPTDVTPEMLASSPGMLALAHMHEISSKVDDMNTNFKRFMANMERHHKLPESPSSSSGRGRTHAEPSPATRSPQTSDYETSEPDKGRKTRAQSSTATRSPQASDYEASEPNKFQEDGWSWELVDSGNDEQKVPPVPVPSADQQIGQKLRNPKRKETPNWWCPKCYNVRCRGC